MFSANTNQVVDTTLGKTYWRDYLPTQITGETRRAPLITWLTGPPEPEIKEKKIAVRTEHKDGREISLFVEINKMGFRSGDVRFNEIICCLWDYVRPFLDVILGVFMG